MSRLWTPPKATREEVDQRQKYTASVEQMVDRFSTVIEQFNPELYKIDPSLELVFIKPNAQVENLPGAVPGRYHVIRKLPDGHVSLIPVVGPRGEFVEPDSGLFTWLAQADLWNERTRRAREEMQARADAARLRQKEREGEERIAELKERYAAISRTQVSMNRDSAWGQNVAGAKKQRASRPKIHLPRAA
jgi:Mg2+ and Co2+ transporter CorA